MHYAILGNGVAGIYAALEIRKRDGQGTITVIGEETNYFYSRTALMWGYTGQLSARDMEPFDRGFWGRMKLHLLRDTVVRIDAQSRMLHLASDATLKYDKLLVAVGARPNLFGWPGQDLLGVGTFTTMQDLEKLIAWRDRIKKAVIVGGGLIGIELVEIMLATGVKTTFLLREPWYWDKALSEPEARVVEKLIRDHGARVVTEDEIGEIHGKDGRVVSLETKKGEKLPCDFVGIAVGVHPKTSLAKSAGLKTRKGIVVNPAMQTSDPHIWSAGDCAEIHYPTHDRPAIEQLWYTGIKQGAAAGQSMVGDYVQYDRGIGYNSAQFMQYDFCTVGQMKQSRPTAEEDFDRGAWNGKEWTCRVAHEGGQVVGLSMMGPRFDVSVMIRWIQERRSPAYCLAHLGDAAFTEELGHVAFKEVPHA